MLSPLSFRLCRQLALCLVLAALLATLAAPLQAAPLDRAAAQGPIAGLIEWFQGLLSALELDGEQESDAPAPAFLPDSGCGDPNGEPGTCSKTVIVGQATDPLPPTKARREPMTR